MTSPVQTRLLCPWRAQVPPVPLLSRPESPTRLGTSETRLLIFSSDPFQSHPSHLRSGHSRLSRPSAQKPPLTPFFFFFLNFPHSVCQKILLPLQNIFKIQPFVFTSPLHPSPSHHHTEPLADSETPRGFPCLCPSTSASVFNPTARMITQITSPE